MPCAPSVIETPCDKTTSHLGPRLQRPDCSSIPAVIEKRWLRLPGFVGIIMRTSPISGVWLKPDGPSSSSGWTVPFIAAFCCTKTGVASIYTLPWCAAANLLNRSVMWLINFPLRRRIPIFKPISLRSIKKIQEYKPYQCLPGFYQGGR